MKDTMSSTFFTLFFRIVFILSSLNTLSGVASDAVRVDMPPENLFDLRFPEYEESWYELPTNWSPVASEDKAKLLRVLVSTVEGSAGELKSFSGNYAINYEQAINSGVAKELNVSDSGDVSMKSSYRVHVYADFQSEKTFRSKKNIREISFETGENKLKTENLTFLDVNSIASKEGYVFSNDLERLETIPELPDFPGTENKRVAWREPMEVTLKQDIVELVNPKEYFDWTVWGNVDKIASEAIHLFEVTGKDGKKWFRLYQQLTSSKSGSKRDLNVFWNEDAGLHPVCSLFVDNSTGALVDLSQVKWEKWDGIFVPTASYVVVYDHYGNLSYRRKMTLSDIEVNKPIPSETFTFSALGLEDGDILVDRIKRKVFTIEKNKPVYLAKFYEKYQTPEERAMNGYRLVFMVSGVALIAWALLSKYWRRRKEK